MKISSSLIMSYFMTFYSSLTLYDLMDITILSTYYFNLAAFILNLFSLLTHLLFYFVS